MMFYPAGGYPGSYFPLLGESDIHSITLDGTAGTILVFDGTAGATPVLDASSGAVPTLDGSRG